MIKSGNLFTLIAAGAFAIVGMGVTSASAASVPFDAGTCALTDLTTSTACDGAFFSANDSEDFLDAIEGIGAFGYNPWELVNKVDAAFGEDGVLETTADAGNLTGDWFADLSGFGSSFEFIAVLKAGNGFAAYLLGDGVDEGTWDTVALNTTNSSGVVTQHALSHFSLYKYECKTGDVGCGGGVTPPPPAVPLPAAGWMLIAGLGGLVAVKRRKFNKAA